jgi:hypothetical protein
MHLTINVKSPNNISKWQMEFNLAFKGLINNEFKRMWKETLKFIARNVAIKFKAVCLGTGQEGVKEITAC